MTVSAVPAYLQNASHSAQIFRGAISAPFATGGILGTGELAVAAQSTPNMSVQIGAGRAVIPGTAVSPPSGFTWTTQFDYFAYNDASVSVTVAASNPTNPRIDAVYIGVQDSFYSGSTNSAAVGIVTGTPAVSPVAPAVPSNSLLLGYIAVAANATTIVTGNITNSVALVTLNNAATSTALTAAIAALAAKIGLTQVAPSSVSNSGGSASATTLGTVTFTAVNSVLLNGIFSSAYTNYRLIWNVTTSTNAGLTANLSAGGTVTTATNYDYQEQAAVGSATTGAQVLAANLWTLSANVLTIHDLTGDIFGPFQAVATRGQSTTFSTPNPATTSSEWAGRGLLHRLLNSYDGLQFACTTGTMTGTLTVYGYNNG